VRPAAVFAEESLLAICDDSQDVDCQWVRVICSRVSVANHECATRAKNTLATKNALKTSCRAICHCLITFGSCCGAQLGSSRLAAQPMPQQGPALELFTASSVRYEPGIIACLQAG